MAFLFDVISTKSDRKEGEDKMEPGQSKVGN